MHFKKLFKVCIHKGHTSPGPGCSHLMSDWRVFLVRSVQCPVCRCAGSTPSHSCLPSLCPQHSLQIEGILTSQETCINLTLFWWWFSLPCFTIVPWCWLLAILVWLQDSLHLAEPLQLQTQTFGNGLVPPFFLFPLFHNAERRALLLNVSKFSWMVSVLDSAVMFMLHATDWEYPRCTQKLLHILPSVGKKHIAFSNCTGPLQQLYFGLLQQ